MFWQTCCISCSTCSQHRYVMSHICRGDLFSSCKMQHRCITVYCKCCLATVSDRDTLFGQGLQSVPSSIIMKIGEGCPPTSPSKVCPLLPLKDGSYYVKKHKFCSGLLTLPRKRFSGDYRGKHYPPSHNNNPLPVA